MNEKTHFQKRKELLSPKVSAKHTDQAVKTTASSLSSYLPALLFGLICLGWLKLDALTGALYQAHIVPACFIICCLLLFQAMNQE